MSSTAGTRPLFSRLEGRLGRNAIYWPLILVWIPLLGWLVAQEWNQIRDHSVELAAWAAVIGLVDLLPLRGRSALFTADEPLALAVSLIFSPAETALVTFAGAFDPGQVKKQTTSAAKALWNRSQSALSWYLASAAVHALNPTPATVPSAIPFAFLALAISTTANYFLVSLWLSLTIKQSVREILSRLHIGVPLDFGLTFASWAALGAMVAGLHEQLGTLALVLSLGPVFLARQALMRGAMFIERDRQYRSREAALAQIMEQTDRERADERRLIAGDLHDEVLQPIFKVNLMAQVVRNDLDRGRLLELEDDVGHLVHASESAADAVRQLVGDLRRSDLGRGGLEPALTRLIALLTEQTRSHIHAVIGKATGTSRQQLGLYQIAKEAIGNAISHARAENIWVELDTADDVLRLTVRDDGVGFDLNSQRPDHYGIEIMRERATAIGADFFLDSSPGAGCILSVLLSPSADEAQQSVGNFGQQSGNAERE